MVTEDDWYNGYFIPKNSIIMMNLWAIHHDPEDYQEPDKVGISCNYANDSINRNDSLVMRSLRQNMRQVQMSINEIISHSVEGEEYGIIPSDSSNIVLVFMLQNRVCLLQLLAFFGDLILNVQRMRMGILFQLISLQRAWFLEVSRRRNLSLVVTPS